jgi:hypothetical protein
MLATVKSGLAALDPQYTPEWSGMLWMQGEFDGGNQGYANEYQTNLANFVKDVRSQLNVPSLPFIIGMIDSSRSWPYAGTIRAAERAVAKSAVNVGLVDTYGFATDGTHYKLDGMIALGKGYAAYWLSKINTPVGLEATDARALAPRTGYQTRFRYGGRLLCSAADCFSVNGRAPALIP